MVAATKKPQLAPAAAAKGKVTKEPPARKTLAACKPKPAPAVTPSQSPQSSQSSQSSSSSSQSTPMLTTSKVWVVPPRPKPGRKPSADTPPSKRKAQNRAAQRAFRERRAARVGELEEELAKMARERDRRESLLQSQMEQIMKDNEELKKNLKVITNTKTTSETEPEVSIADLDRALEEKLPVVNHDADDEDDENDDDKCGFCIKDSCLCESVGLRTSGSQPILKPQKPIMEIDFTAQFAKPKKDQSCGFCHKSPCACFQSIKLPPLNAMPSPPPSENEYPPSPQPQVRKLPTLQPDPVLPSITGPVYECTGTPGNCMQCQQDPMSTLFCTTLASRAQMSTKPNGTFIPVSAAYQTLSRHKDFGKADMGQLVGKLQTHGGQVEVSSVATVLRELDRRLYD